MAENGRISLKGVLRTLLNIGIAAAVIFWLYRRNGAALRTGFAEFDYRFLIPAAAVLLSTLVVSSLRWRGLARTIGIRLGAWESFSLTMQGNFFSLVIPGGAIGGDVIKMAALTRHVRSGSRTEGIVSIVMDRIIGMIALFLMTTLLLLFSRGLFGRRLLGLLLGRWGFALKIGQKVVKVVLSIHALSDRNESDGCRQRDICPEVRHIELAPNELHCVLYPNSFYCSRASTV